MQKKSVMILALLQFFSSLTLGDSFLLDEFSSTYPQSKTTDRFSCKICHQAPVPALNGYGTDYVKEGYDFVSIESLDSDGDGVTNLEEILTEENPGEKPIVY